MGDDYIPERDLKAAIWMKFFAGGIVESPQAYRATPEEAAEIDELVLAFRTANARAWSNATSTMSATRAKNLARKAAEQVIRPTAQRIRTDARIDDVLKVQIGIKPKSKRRRRIPLPQSVPVLYAKADLGGGLAIRVHDSATHRRARPREARAMELYERIIPREVMDGPRPADATDAADPSERPFANAWRFIGLYTRTPITIRPVNTQPGDQASYRGRWVTARGEPAAFGNVISLRLPFTSAPRVSACMPRDRRAAA